MSTILLISLHWCRSPAAHFISKHVTTTRHCTPSLQMPILDNLFMFVPISYRPISSCHCIPKTWHSSLLCSLKKTFFLSYDFQNLSVCYFLNPGRCWTLFSNTPSQLRFIACERFGHSLSSSCLYRQVFEKILSWNQISADTSGKFDVVKYLTSRLCSWQKAAEWRSETVLEEYNLKKKKKRSNLRNNKYKFCC